jgi:uncharacterized membrane protein
MRQEIKMNRLTKYFLKGLLIFVPVALTVFAFIWFFRKLDSSLGHLLGTKIPGLGIIVTIVVIFIVGFVASSFLGKKLFGLVESVFTKTPLVKMIYSSVKDLVGAFAGDKKKFDKPVIVELMPGGAKVLGFVTRESLEFLGLPGHMAVYLPQSYNFAGQVLIFPSAQIKPIKIDSSEAMRFIVSGGVSGGGQS